MKVIAVIPARYKSSRFPGKPLVSLCGKPMVIRVAELCAEAVGHDSVYVATDDQRISEVVEAAGYQAIITSDSALTGTDRLAEVAGLIDADIYVNVQGDEPLVDPNDIVQIVDEKRRNPDSVVNGYCEISADEDVDSLNIPKVIFSENGQMIYMSRNRIPGVKNPKDAVSRYFKQVCIYAFSRNELHAFAAFGRKSTLEASEDIEILRFLDIGVPVRMVKAQPGSLAVDVPQDVAPVEVALRDMHKL